MTAVEAFFKNVKCLVVEPSHSFASIIRSSLEELGVATGSVVFARNFEQAIEAVAELQPKVVISEYEINKRHAFELAEAQRMYLEDPNNSIFFIISKNSTHVAVAESAEEDVDGYLLKPFAQSKLTDRLKMIAEQVINPSPYITKIRSGKEHLIHEEFAEAEEMFLAATEMDKEPSLAWYYTGYISKEKKDLQEASVRFMRGLSFKPLHYKCLVGQFNALFEMKKYEEAYMIAKTLTESFPVTPSRLGRFFITAVYTKKFTDIAHYYELFKELDHRPDELIRVMSAASLAGGKYFLQTNDLDKTKEYFLMTLTIAGRKGPHYLNILNTLLEAEKNELARYFYERMDPAMVGSPLHSQYGFKIDLPTMPVTQRVEVARQLIEKGHADAFIYEHAVAGLYQLDMKVAAETMAMRGGQDFPDLVPKLNELEADYRENSEKSNNN